MLLGELTIQFWLTHYGRTPNLKEWFLICFVDNFARWVVLSPILITALICFTPNSTPLIPNYNYWTHLKGENEI